MELGHDMDLFLRVEPAHNNNQKKSKKKRQTQGPFYWFMMDKKEEWTQEGKWNENFSTKHLVDQCMPLWKILKTNPNLLEPYILKARDWKESQRQGLEDIYDTHGRSLADIRREARKVKERMDKMMEDIEMTVASAGRNVVRKSFFIAHFNYLCKTDWDFYIPCEAAVTEFNIEGGIIKTWHKFISPLDSIPIGYKFRCISYARNTHFLTPDFEKYETDMKSVLESLVEFLGGDEDDLPPLYVLPDQMPVADCITNFIHTKAKSNIPQLKVFSLTKLLKELAHYPSIHIAESFLEDETKYSHVRGLGCDLHESLQNAAHCALSFSQRNVFNVLHYCCQVYKIQLKPGKHVPQDRWVSLMPHEIKMENLAIEDRINRMIPAPAGVTDIPHGLDEELSKKLEVGDPGYFGARPKNPQGWGHPQKYLDLGSLGAVPKQYPSEDVREKDGNVHKILSFRPAIVKSGSGIIINK